MDTPQRILLQLGKEDIAVFNDRHSDRVRCDHPGSSDGRGISFFLIGAATCMGRSKVLTMVNEALAPQMQEFGFNLAGTMPRFYNGKEGCSVLTYNFQDKRRSKANPKEVARAAEIFRQQEAFEDEEIYSNQSLETKRATPEDAQEIAHLIDLTFTDYPTPSHDPEYVKTQIEEGTPFRYIKRDSKMVACASADLVRVAKTAELTDCATLPEYRKQGMMFSLLFDLMKDLEEMDYKTAFTYARARVPGINVVFKKLGFSYCGQVSQSCRIGDGLEDMNMWIRDLPVDAPSEEEKSK